jgi:hypothetical protein
MKKIFVQAGEEEQLGEKLSQLAQALRILNAWIVTGCRSLTARTLRAEGVNVKLLSPVGSSNTNVGWCLRLAEFLSADAALFLPGSMGMLAHLFPFLAHVIKGEVKKGKLPRRIVLLGWSQDQLGALFAMLQVFAGIAREETAVWLGVFDVNQIEESVRFLDETPAR